MLRKFLTYDGEVLAEEEWAIKPIDRCFYCNHPLILSQNTQCPIGFSGIHDFVTLVSPGT